MATKAAFATGRRKTSTARVYMFPKGTLTADGKLNKEAPAAEEKGKIVVNGRAFENYFGHDVRQMVINQPLEVTDRLGHYDFRVLVQGGGIAGQAGAIRHGIARVLQKTEPELRGALKKEGFLTRDPRAVERKKPGRHKARKRPQFSKR